MKIVLVRAFSFRRRTGCERDATYHDLLASVGTDTNNTNAVHKRPVGPRPLELFPNVWMQDKSRKYNREQAGLFILVLLRVQGHLHPNETCFISGEMSPRLARVLLSASISHSNCVCFCSMDGWNIFFNGLLWSR
jgi:hypothetical protein